MAIFETRAGLREGVAIILLGLSAWPCPADACKTLPPCAVLAPLGSAETAATSLGSTDASVVARAALTLASSSAPSELRTLGRALEQPTTLNQIMQLETGERCVMPQILAALAGNPEAEARTQFAALISSPSWAEDPNRADGAELTDVLLRATGVFRPPTPEVVAMWKRLSLPHDGWVNVTVMALTENGSEAAAQQLAALLRDPRHDVEERVAWLREDYIAHRDNPLLLQMANRLLDRALPAALKTAIADTTFDLHVESYGTCGPPTVPPFASFAPNARKELRSIAGKVRARKPNARLAHAIAAALEELRHDA